MAITRKQLIKQLRAMKAAGKSRADARTWIINESGYKNAKGQPVSESSAYANVRRVWGNAYGKRTRYRHAADKAVASTNPRSPSGFKALVKAIGQLDLVERDKLALIQLVAEL